MPTDTKLVAAALFTMAWGTVVVGCSSTHDTPSSPTSDSTTLSDAQSPADAGGTGSKASIQDAGAEGTSTQTADAEHAGELGPWEPMADYPLGGNCTSSYCPPQTCVENSGYVYCVGASSTSTYYSQLSSTGVGAWARGADYPVPIRDASCVVASNTIYCVGGVTSGVDGGQTEVANVYYAPLLSPGIGAWTASAPYPTAPAGRCMVDSGTIYCISGVGDGGAYFAPVSSSGVGTWSPTTAPTSYTGGCVAIGGYAYCFGAGDCEPGPPGTDCYSPSYFAPVSANGIGSWSNTTDIPAAASATFGSAGSTIYWLSTPVFFATVSASGIGPWQTTTNYPESGYPSGCVSNGGYLYCPGVGTNSSYFAQIGAPDPQALQLTTPLPFPRADYLAPACSNGGDVSVNDVGAPAFGNNVDDAVVFGCASQAATDAGCTTTVNSPVAQVTGLVGTIDCDYQMTIWYPCNGPTPAGTTTNCCFLPAVGYPSPAYGWCADVGSNSFIITNEITLQPATTTVIVDDGGLPP